MRGRVNNLVIESKINDEISKIVLKNNKVSVEILNLGAIVEKKINVEDRYGNKENIVLAYKDEESYIENPSSLGAIVGRVAGRIGKGSFKLNDKIYELDKNNNGNCLHGGYKGFSKKKSGIIHIVKMKKKIYSNIYLLLVRMEKGDSQEI